MLRGQKIFYNTGELSFETNPREAGTFKGVFLEELGRGLIKILDKNDRLRVMDKSLVSQFNL